MGICLPTKTEWVPVTSCLSGSLTHGRSCGGSKGTYICGMPEIREWTWRPG
jgi:hypothetical protein